MKTIKFRYIVLIFTISVQKNITIASLLNLNIALVPVEVEVTPIIDKHNSTYESIVIIPIIAIESKQNYHYIIPPLAYRSKTVNKTSTVRIKSDGGSEEMKLANLRQQNIDG